MSGSKGLEPSDPSGKRAQTGELTPEDRKFLEELARWLAVRRLTVPAVLFLESTKPLNFVGSQFLFFFEPVVMAFFDGRGYTRFAALMEDRDNVEEFLRLIESTDQELQERRKEKTR
jgi:hypothetical protein